MRSANSVIGEMIRAQRKAKGLSQSKFLVQLLGESGIDLHQTALSKVESGARSLRFDEAVWICRLLDLDVSVLAGAQLGGEEGMRLARIAALRAELESLGAD